MYTCIYISMYLYIFTRKRSRTHTHMLYTQIQTHLAPLPPLVHTQCSKIWLPYLWLITFRNLWLITFRFQGPMCG